ncbi:hypothetical protein KO495_15300 [Colwellia sp. D2M02]|uniref:chondroitinase-B domain-containing protein n=1 Tax=Colwellia sp. D2M02 TaxID=2841562 RepID=UPI001C07EF92|nr:hypothetical protein [Colwellia sp. D2M02]
MVAILKRYFIIIGALANIFMAVIVAVVLLKVYSTGLSLPLFSEKVKNNLQVNQPNLYRIVAPILNTMSYFEVENYYFRQIDLANWSGTGANKKSTYQSRLEDIYVSNASELLTALKKVKPGQTVLLLPGKYKINQASIQIGNSGTSHFPIKVTAASLGTVKLLIKGEGFVVNKPYWQFSNLHLIGNCKSHTQCEHAFHVVGKAQHTVIKNNIMQDFNAMIKVNGVSDSYPDYGRVQHNTFFNTSPRKTANPVTPFDLMHASYWQVSDNFIFDIQKSAGDKVSYAAFFKGGSEQGVFERNLVICAANLSDDYTALGLSLGGGGSLQQHRRNQNSAEHVGGVIRHNIIMHCSNDVGIYVNRSRNSLIAHNTLYNTLGIDVRYPESTANVEHNILSGRIKNRDNATIIQANNLIENRNFLTGKDTLSNYFVAPDIGNFSWKKPLESLPRDKSSAEYSIDFCQNLPSKPYVGAYSSDSFCTYQLNLTSQTNSNDRDRLVR